MGRAIIIVLDSVGCGGAADAAAYGDAGPDTLGHLAAACAEGKGDRAGLRAGPLRLPHLDALGLGLAMRASSGCAAPGFACAAPRGQWGYGIETSNGKDTPSGHWEIAGTPVAFDWGYFPPTIPTFPASLTAALIAEAKLPGILGDRHASGTAIIAELGEEHMRTGKPICYTSANSVFQIAAHEETFGLERLYELCQHCAAAVRSAGDRPRHRPAVRRRGPPPISPAPPTARISRSRRCPTICCSARSRRGARS